MINKPTMWERMAFPEHIEPDCWYKGINIDNKACRFTITRSGQLYVVLDTRGDYYNLSVQQRRRNNCCYPNP